MERGVIEIAPLAYMRGRTLNNAFIILDEAQNSTAEQMFMFLTRLGIEFQGGDHRATPRRSICRRTNIPDLLEAQQALQGVEGIALVELTRARRGAASAGATDHRRLRGTSRPARQ